MGEPVAGNRAPPSAQDPGARSEGGRLAPTLSMCPSCYQFVWPMETACPFCGIDIAAGAVERDRERARLHALMAEVDEVVSAGGRRRGGNRGPAAAA